MPRQKADFECFYEIRYHKGHYVLIITQTGEAKSIIYNIKELVDEISKEILATKMPLFTRVVAQEKIPGRRAGNWYVLNMKKSNWDSNYSASSLLDNALDKATIYYYRIDCEAVR